MSNHGKKGGSFSSDQNKKIGLLKSPIFIENKENDTTKSDLHLLKA